MNCDELKYEKLGDMMPFYPRSTLVIRKQFVDAAIAELKRENERLNRELEHVKNGDCINTCDVVEKHVKEEIKAKRALWLARAERAASWQIHFSLCHNHSIEREFSINGASMPCEGMATMRTAKDWAMIWKKVERLCLKKAEEYK